MSDFSATLWTAARQAPLFMGFPRQEYWNGLPFPSPEALPEPGIERVSYCRQILHHLGHQYQFIHSKSIHSDTLTTFGD